MIGRGRGLVLGVLHEDTSKLPDHRGMIQANSPGSYDSSLGSSVHRNAGTLDPPRAYPSTRTMSLPKLRPSNMPMKASGAFSSPSTKSSRYRMRPSAMPAPTSRRKAG